jgi:hypothetical protein
MLGTEDVPVDREPQLSECRRNGVRGCNRPTVNNSLYFHGLARLPQLAVLQAVIT